MSAPLRPIAFVLAATNHGTMILNRHDYRLTGAGGYGMAHQLLNNSAYDPREVNLLQALLSLKRRFAGGEEMVMLDGGANIGVHTVECARHMHGWGRMIAIEAQERLFYALAGNIALNNCFNARARNAALGRQAVSYSNAQAGRRQARHRLRSAEAASTFSNKLIRTNSCSDGPARPG